MFIQSNRPINFLHRTLDNVFCIKHYPLHLAVASLFFRKVSEIISWSVFVSTVRNFCKLAYLLHIVIFCAVCQLTFFYDISIIDIRSVSVNAVRIFCILSFLSCIKKLSQNTLGIFKIIKNIADRIPKTGHFRFFLFYMDSNTDVIKIDKLQQKMVKNGSWFQP